MWQGFHRCDLGDKGPPSGASALRFALAAAVQAGARPPSIESVWEASAWRLDDDNLLGRKRRGFGRQGRRGKLLFIGVSSGMRHTNSRTKPISNSELESMISFRYLEGDRIDSIPKWWSPGELRRLGGSTARHDTAWGSAQHHSANGWCPRAAAAPSWLLCSI
jgi:hypothetical protein